MLLQIPSVQQEAEAGWKNPGIKLVDGTAGGEKKEIKKEFPPPPSHCFSQSFPLVLHLGVGVARCCRQLGFQGIINSKKTFSHCPSSQSRAGTQLDREIWEYILESTPKSVDVGLGMFLKFNHHGYKGEEQGIFLVPKFLGMKRNQGQTKKSPQLLPLSQEVSGIFRNSFSLPGKPGGKLVLLPIEVTLPRGHSWRNPDSQTQQHLEHPPGSPRPQFQVEKLGKILGKVESPLKFRLNFSEEVSPTTSKFPKIPRVRSHPWDTPGATSPFPNFPYSSPHFLDCQTKEFLRAEIPPISSCCFFRDAGWRRITMGTSNHHPIPKPPIFPGTGMKFLKNLLMFSASGT